jgi:acetate---CoA ligase (ADP-forming)
MPAPPIPANPAPVTGDHGSDRHRWQHRPGLTAMLEARSIALVGASARAGSLGARMVAEVSASPGRPRLYPVNPRYTEVGGLPCHPRLADLPEPVDLVLLAVPDPALEEQLKTAAARGDRSAVIFGSAFDPPGQPAGLRDRLAAIARSAGMALCGAGCMGFVNVAHGLRAVGYVEPDPIPAGPVALVTHSGSVFSTMLRSRRGFGFSVVVSSGQELVSTAADYAGYALDLPQTKVIGLVLEAIRDAGRLRAVLARARAAGVPVVALAVGGSASGRDLVAAHSGALAAADGAWEALAGAYGVHRVGDLAEFADTLELFALTPRPPTAPGPVPAAPTDGAAAAARGIATVHDSGLERAHVADLAERLGVPFAAIGERTRGRLAAVLDPGLEPANPLDMWGTGRDAQQQLTDSMVAMAQDPAVATVAFAVDLVPEFDGDDSYPLALLAAARQTSKPVVVLAGLPASIDQVTAARLRAAGIPVLEGTRTGLLAVRHLLDHAAPVPAPVPPPGPDPARRGRWLGALARGQLTGAEQYGLLRDYGIPAVRVRPAASAGAALAAAEEIGYPVVLKTDEPGVAHKSDAGGVLLGLDGKAALLAAYRDLAARLGPRTLVCQTAAPGTELVVGIATDPALGPLIVAGAGGVHAEWLADRAVALPPVGQGGALRMLRRLRVSGLLAGLRGEPPADLASIAGVIAGVSAIAGELGGHLAALDVNPLICGPGGAVAADVLVVSRPHAESNSGDTNRLPAGV